MSTWWGERDYVGDSDELLRQHQAHGVLRLHRSAAAHRPAARAGAVPRRVGRGRPQIARGTRLARSSLRPRSPAARRNTAPTSRRSRGEFSWAKASCMKFQNAWVSDRSLCYLASGKPVVVQHTGPSSFLPDGEGMFRFRRSADAAQALRCDQRRLRAPVPARPPPRRGALRRGGGGGRHARASALTRQLRPTRA